MSLLDSIKIAKPCPVAWDSMKVVDDRTRFCSMCSCHVHDIANMTKVQAEALIQRPGKICIQIYRRPDGTVKTNDCRDKPYPPQGYKMPEPRRGMLVMTDKPKKKGRKPPESPLERLAREDTES